MKSTCVLGLAYSKYTINGKCDSHRSWGSAQIYRCYRKWVHAWWCENNSYNNRHSSSAPVIQETTNYPAKSQTADSFSQRSTSAGCSRYWKTTFAPEKIIPWIFPWSHCGRWHLSCLLQTVVPFKDHCLSKPHIIFLIFWHWSPSDCHRLPCKQITLGLLNTVFV